VVLAARFKLGANGINIAENATLGLLEPDETAHVTMQ
jgi:hypothetical protein